MAIGSGKRRTWSCFPCSFFTIIPHPELISSIFRILFSISIRIHAKNFGRYRFPGSSQIPNPVKSFLIYVLYFVQIWDPRNIRPYPVNSAYRPISVWQLRFTKVNTELTHTSFNIENCSNYALSLAVFNVYEDCNVQIFLWLSKRDKFLRILFSWSVLTTLNYQWQFTQFSGSISH